MTRLEVTSRPWRSLTTDERAAYRALVDACPYSTVFHTPEWIDALEDSFAPASRCLVAREGARVLGAFPYFEVGGPWPGRSRHSCLRDRDMVYGGPLAASPGEDTRVLDALLRRFERGPATLLSTVLPGPGFPESALRSRGYRLTARLTARVDLGGSRESGWRELHPKTRNMIGKARRSGVSVRWATTEEDLLHLPEMIAEPYRRAGAPAPPPHYLLRVARRLGRQGLARPLIAVRDGRIVAGAIFLRYRDVSYYWAGGALPEGYETAASHLVQWEAMEAARAAGCRLHDMVMLSPARAPGIARFKLRFGARVVSLWAAERRTLAGRLLARLGRLAPRETPTRDEDAGRACPGPAAPLVAHVHASSTRRRA